MRKESLDYISGWTQAELSYQRVGNEAFRLDLTNDSAFTEEFLEGWADSLKLIAENEESAYEFI